MSGITTIFSQKGEALFTSMLSSETTAKPSEQEDISKSVKHILWGENDDLPTLLINDAEKDTIILPGIRFKSEMQYGAGIAHGKIEIVESKEVYMPLRDDKVVAFMRRNNLDFQVFQALYDLNYMAIAFFHLIKGKGGEIVKCSLENTRAKTVRLGKRDSKGNIKSVFINPDFGTDSYKESNTKEIPCAPSFDPVKWFQNDKIKECVVIVRMPDAGRQYYPLPDWNTARKSEWYQVSQSIAKFKKYLMENQMTIKYHIEIHPDYWPKKYGPEAWKTMTAAEKQTKMQEWVDNFSEFMKGAKGSGNSLLTPQAIAEGMPDKVYSYVTITELKNNFSKDGTYVEDSREASMHKMAALGIHPEILGNTPSSTMGAGSGSGNRVAFNQRVSMSKFIQDIVLHPLGIIRDFNGWDSEIVFRMRNSLITTLDTGASATKPSPSTSNES